jgi:hypothetical protein
VNVALPWHDKELDSSVEKALGEFVSDVMTAEVASVKSSATVEDVATLMHDRKISRVPVVDTTNRLVGIITRSDILRAMVLGLDEPTAEEVAEATRGSDAGATRGYDAGDELEEMLGERAASDVELAAREKRAAALAEQAAEAQSPSEDDADFGTDIGTI